MLNVNAGIYNIKCKVSNVNLTPGTYVSDIWLGSPYDMYDWIRECISFYVSQNSTFIQRETPYDAYSKVVLPSNWSLLV